MAVKEDGGVMDGKELWNMDAGEAEERQGLPEARGNAKGLTVPKNQPGGAQMRSL